MIPLLVLLVLLAGLLLSYLLSGPLRPSLESKERAVVWERRLHAGQVCRVVGSADYQYLARKNRRYREELFADYAPALKEDVRELVSHLSGTSARLAALTFYLFYLLLALKSRIHTGIGDLELLLSLELNLIRQLAGQETRPESLAGGR